MPKILKLKSLDKRLWCNSCLKKDKPVLRLIAFKVPKRKSQYMAPTSDNLDVDECGVCAECLELKNDFQKKNAYPVDSIVRDVLFNGKI